METRRGLKELLTIDNEASLILASNWRICEARELVLMPAKSGFLVRVNLLLQRVNQVEHASSAQLLAHFLCQGAVVPVKVQVGLARLCVKVLEPYKVLLVARCYLDFDGVKDLWNFPISTQIGRKVDPFQSLLPRVHKPKLTSLSFKDDVKAPLDK
eukprot:symbB.v1.2.037326.t1/scaffold5207.1/size83351/2